VIATGIYALAEGHFLPIAWIAARHTLLATAFSLLAFWLHARAREDGWTAGRALSLLAFALGLLAGEMALGAAVLIGAWELLARRDPIGRRIAALAPAAALAVLYVASYAAMGYGARHSGAYLDPASGITGAIGTLRHFWILIGELVAATPSDVFGVATPTVQAVGAVWGGLVAAAAWAVFRVSRAHADPRERAAARWMVLSAAGAALPGTFALVGGRVLTLAWFPASGVMAVVLVRGLAAARDHLVPKVRRVFVAIVIACFGLGDFVMAPVLRLGLGVWFTRMAHVEYDLAASLPSCPGTLVLVSGSDPMITTYVPGLAGLLGHPTERIRALSVAPYDRRIENVTTTGFDLVTVAANPERSMWERLYRSEPLPAGTDVRLPSFDARVIEDRAGTPVRVRFDFEEPLDSSRLCFFEWRDAEIRPFRPPRRGETIDLPYQPGPMGW
jgi:hypothetical protein